MSVWAHSPPREEGWTRHQKMFPFREGADGVVARELHFGMRFETSRVSDHPVCGASVASRLFINAVATPPHGGGECARYSKELYAEDSSFASDVDLHSQTSRIRPGRSLGRVVPSCPRRSGSRSSRWSGHRRLHRTSN